MKILAVILFCMAGAVSAMAAPPPLPPVVDPATQAHRSGKVVLVEMVTPDLAADEKFYGGLFGWKFRDIKSGAIKYAAATLDGHPVAGFIHKSIPPGEQHQPAWLTFISADDVDAAKELALKNGAKLLFGPRDIPDRGQEAVFADPQGAVFAVLDSSSGDPSDALPAPGEWIWSSLITSDPDEAAGFYQTLFNYEIAEMPADKGARHLLLTSGDYARASVNPLPAKGAHNNSYWLNYVRVKNTVKAVAKVVKLGGHVLVKPHVDRHGGKIAVVTDPLGAPFGLVEWSDTDKEAPR